MATYDAWNRAIIDHVTVGIPLGSMVYLAIDEEVIAQIGRSMENDTVPQGDALADFTVAVRDQVVRGKRVAIDALRQLHDDSRPNGVAFLALMVLAASRMAGEEVESGRINQTNYLRRLCESLGLEQGGGGRPTGLPSGEEAPLWQEWNIWLQTNGFVSTARLGRGSHKFVDYPVYQTLLRKTDKDRLRQLFASKRWMAGWDGDTVLIQLRALRNELNRYLHELVTQPGPRYQALADSLYELHASWRESPDDVSAISGSVSAALRCGVMRDYDPIMGTLTYRLYPRMPPSRKVAGGTVRQGDANYRLTRNREGWFEALSDLSGHELTAGASYPVEGIDGITRAVLPAQSFWVLVPDPDEPDSGIFASWHHPTLGEQAIVLITRHAFDLLQRLRAEGLVDWVGQERSIASLGDEWLEVRDCLVTSEALGGVFGEEQALFEKLRPVARLGISTRGGLRSPDRRGWIVDHGPEITVMGFDDEVEYRVTRVEDDIVIDECTVPSRVPRPLAARTPGTYRIDASSGGHQANPRLVRLVNWEELCIASNVDYSSITVGDMQIRGATLRPISDGGT